MTRDSMKPAFDLSLYLVTDPVLAGGRDLWPSSRPPCAAASRWFNSATRRPASMHFADQAEGLLALLRPLRHSAHRQRSRRDRAAAVGADGVHVGQDDADPRIVREQMGPDAILGLSAGTPQEFAAVPPGVVDYLGVGPICATGTKPDHDPPLGSRRARGAGPHRAASHRRDRRDRPRQRRRGPRVGRRRHGGRLSHLRGPGSRGCRASTSASRRAMTDRFNHHASRRAALGRPRRSRNDRARRSRAGARRNGTLAHGDILADATCRVPACRRGGWPSASRRHVGRAGWWSTSSRRASCVPAFAVLERRPTASPRWATRRRSSGRARLRRGAVHHRSLRPRPDRAPGLDPGQRAGRRSGTGSTRPSACGASLPAIPGRPWAAGSAGGEERVADLRGLRIRVQGLGGDVYLELGATPQAIPPGDVYPRWSAAPSMRWSCCRPPTTCRSASTRWRRSITCRGSTSRTGPPRRWSRFEGVGIPAARTCRAIVEEACDGRAWGRPRRSGAQQCRRARDSSIAQGARPTAFPPDVMAAARKAADTVIDRMAAKDAACRPRSSRPAAPPARPAGPGRGVQGYMAQQMRVG